MRQMLFRSPGTVQWEETATPVLSSPAAALVEPVAVATCDLDVAALQGRYPLEGPYPFGHEAVATVSEVGPEVTGVTPGDRVVVPFQISCGDCRSCRRGRTGNCMSHPPLSTFGLGTMGGIQWGGLLADMALIPHADAMLVPISDEVDPVALASVSDNVSDAWRCVGPQLEADPDADVLVVGGDGGPNSIGLYAAGLAVAQGASRVVYLDDDEARLAVAHALGAEIMQGPPPRKAGSFAITVDASGSEHGLRCAVNSTAFDGRFTVPTIYVDDPALPMFSMYSRCCTLHTGRAHVRPAIPAVLDAVARGFNPSLVTAAVVGWDDAEDALADPPMKLVLERRA